MKFTEYLDQVDGRVKAATPKPWYWDGFTSVRDEDGHRIGEMFICADTELVVHSPTDLTRLVAAARRMHEALDKAAAALLGGEPIVSHFQDGSAAYDLHCAVIEAAEHIHKALTAVDKIGGGE